MSGPTFKSLQPHKQVLLVALLGLGLAALVFTLAVLPLHRKLDALRSEQADLATDLAEVKALSLRYQTLQNSTMQSATGASLTALVDQSLQNKAFQPSRIQQSEAGALQLRVENVDFAQVLPWLDELEQTPGLALGAVSVSKTGSKVNVLLTLLQR